MQHLSRDSLIAISGGFGQYEYYSDSDLKANLYMETASISVFATASTFALTSWLDFAPIAITLSSLLVGIKAGQWAHENSQYYGKEAGVFWVEYS